MALAQIKLDDLTWADMVKAIRGRIATDSNGQWTLHAAVDPGATLLDLFAWLLEQRIYRMDQIPDSLVRACLTMMGEQSRLTQSAGTVFQFPSDDFRRVPAKTEMGLVGSAPPQIFSTDSDFTVLPIAESGSFEVRLGLFIAGRDRTPDLRQGRVLRLFPADGSSGEIKIVFWLTKPLKHQPGDKLSLLFELRPPQKVLPQWSPAASANIPAPAKVVWSYSSGTSSWTSFKAGEVNDGTGGFRRSGVVRLPLKNNWQVDDSIKAEPGRFAYSIVIRVAQTTFTSPPRLSRLIPNVAIARHNRATRLHPLDRSWLPLPGNVIALSELSTRDGVKDFPPLEATVRLRLKERDNQWHRWHWTEDLSHQGPGDRVFTVDREQGVVRFGDGLTGRLPVLAPIAAKPNSENIRIRYQVGGGSSGNVGARLSWEDTGDLKARNLVAAIGGAEAETIEQVRQRVAADLQQRNRAITPADHESIAVTTTGVAFQRAHAAIGFHPGHPCALVPGATTVFVVPEAPREEIDEAYVESAFVPAPQPDPGSLAVVRARFDRARLLGSELFVSGPRYRKVTIKLEVDAGAADQQSANQRIKSQLKTFLDPLTGGDQGDGWPFGEPLRPSALMRQAQRALGDDGVVSAVNIYLEGRPPQSSCDDVPIGPHDLVSLQDIVVELNQSTQSQGGLR
jgi:predicted phage baseplate assembly protein